MRKARITDTPKDIKKSNEALDTQSDNIENLAEIRQQLGKLDKAIDELPHDLKTALILFHLEEKSQRECTKHLGVTAKTVEMRIYRARKILREKLSLVFEGE